MTRATTAVPLHSAGTRGRHRRPRNSSVAPPLGAPRSSHKPRQLATIDLHVTSSQALTMRLQQLHTSSAPQQHHTLLRLAARQVPVASRHACRPARRRAVDCAAKPPNNGDDEPSTSTSGTSVPAALLLFVGSAAYTLTNMRDQLQDLLYNDDDAVGDFMLAGLGLGDLAGAAIWAAALWYSSPLQLLLAFLGRVDRERPSDWIISRLGRAAGLPTEAIDYVAPWWIVAAAAASCGAGGLAIAALLGNSLGDPTWSVSSGIGALFAGAIFEAGRPARLSVAEAQQLEAQWQDFAAFANDKLQRSGRCHESEVFAAFRRAHGRYRSPDAISDVTLRDMVRNWHPGVERTRTGYLRNMSVRAPANAAAAAAAAAAARGGSSQAAAAANGQAAAAEAAPGEASLLDNIAAAAAAETQPGEGVQMAELQQQQQQQRP